MEKETLRQIQLLKSVKPSKNWVSSTRKELLGREEFSVSLLFRPAVAFTGAFVLLLGMGFFQTIVAPLSEEGHPLAEEEGGVMIASEEDVTEKKDLTVEEIENISYELGEFEKQYKQVQRDVFEAYVMASVIDNGSKQVIEDKDIAEQLLFEMERAYPMYNREERDFFSNAQDAFEEERYDVVLDIFLSLR